MVTGKAEFTSANKLESQSGIPRGGLLLLRNSKLVISERHNACYCSIKEGEHLELRTRCLKPICLHITPSFPPSTWTIPRQSPGPRLCFATCKMGIMIMATTCWALLCALHQELYLYFFFKILFLSNLYTQCRAQTYKSGANQAPFYLYYFI